MENTTVMNPQSFLHVAIKKCCRMAHCQTLEGGATMDLFLGTNARFNYLN